MTLEPKKPLSQFEQMPFAIQELVMKCLNAQEMGTSAAAISVFNKLLEKNETWLQVAHKLNVNIVDVKNAKKEFLEHYAYIKSVNDVLLEIFPDNRVAPKDPFALRNILEEFIDEYRNDEFMVTFTENLLSLIASEDSPLAHATDAQIDAAACLLSLGVEPRNDFKEWVEEYVRPAAEIYPEIFRAALRLEDKLYHDGLRGTEFLLMKALNANQHEKAKMILEEGYMPSEKNLSKTLDWAITHLNKKEPALSQLCDYADAVIGTRQKKGQRVDDLQKKVKTLRS